MRVTEVHYNVSNRTGGGGVVSYLINELFIVSAPGLDVEENRSAKCFLCDAVSCMSKTYFG